MWWKDGVIYQIYPRSFRDTNGDGIGDLKGIISKLDYLNDGTTNSLGVDGIWISPFFRSPMKDFGYDISDYREIDPIFGTLDDFRLLLSEAHKRNIHIIIDMVLNHTSEDHPWFRESRLDKTNPKADWYLWHPGKEGRRPNNWFSQFELKNAWWYDDTRGEFYLGTFTRNQPELNWRNPELREEMFELARYWLDMGVDGFRLDVINWFIKDKDFKSNPYSLKSVDLQKHIYDRNQPEAVDICRELRKITDGYEERMLVGEVYTDDPVIASSYYGNGNDALHMTFNFNFLFQKWKAPMLRKSILDWYDSLPEVAWPNFTFSNHDNLRHCFRYRAGKWTNARAKVAAALLLTLKGTPFIYYGEEIGMTGGKLAKKDMVDPLSKKTWPLKRFCRDLARTPMQWDASWNAGFMDCVIVPQGTGGEGADFDLKSAAKPWLPVDKGYRDNNVDVQTSGKASLLNFYKELIWLRKKHPVLQAGAIRFVDKGHPEIMAYVREDESESILVVLNFTGKIGVFDLEGAMPEKPRRRLKSFWMSAMRLP
ncbi:MAG: alpha-glucosidase [Clostridiales bacterium]|nr:alpha-glucosidase [Clostridiales bacterium]